ncbi:MAG: GNAT family N-acetyltransferase [Erysipelotrichaceae bacterium]
MNKIKLIDHNQLEQALDLVLGVYDEFVGETSSKQGNTSFYEYCNLDKVRKQIENKEMIMWGYYQDELIGVTALIKEHVGLLFVNKEYHNQGIGRALLEVAKKQCIVEGYQEISINALPYAVDIYHHIGFVDTDTIQNKDGIVYTPMRMFLM